MNSGQFLSIYPQELQFPFELKKQITCTIQVRNNTENYVAYKVRTTNPKRYCVRPNTGIVLPYSTCDVSVTMQAQKEAPAGMQCKDKFLFQSVITNPKCAVKDITYDMFEKVSGNLVDEYKINVTFVAPPQPIPAIVQEACGGESSASDNMSLVNVIADLSGALVQSQNDLTQANALIYRLTEEKNAIIQLNNKLQQEMDSLRLEINQ